MKKIEAIIKPFKLNDVKEALNGIGILGISRCIIFLKNTPISWR